MALPVKKTAVWMTGFYPAYGGLSFASCNSKTGKYCDLITAAGLQVRPPRRWRRGAAGTRGADGCGGSCSTGPRTRGAATTWPR